MAQVGDILRITSCQRMFNEELCNIFYYVVKVWTGNAGLSDLWTAFDNAVNTSMAAVQYDGLTYDRTTIENVTDGVGLFTQASTQVGQVSSTDPLPPFVTATIVFPRQNKTTRQGRKAVSGLTEGVIQNGQIQPGTVGWQAVATSMASELAVGTPGQEDILVAPIILGRTPTGQLDLTRYQEIITGEYPYLSTQNSRKNR